MWIIGSISGKRPTVSFSFYCSFSILVTPLGFCHLKLLVLAIFYLMPCFFSSYSSQIAYLKLHKHSLQTSRHWMVGCRSFWGPFPVRCSVRHSGIVLRQTHRLTHESGGYICRSRPKAPTTLKFTPKFCSTCTIVFFFLLKF